MSTSSYFLTYSNLDLAMHTLNAHYLELGGGVAACCTDHNGGYLLLYRSLAMHILHEANKRLQLKLASQKQDPLLFLLTFIIKSVIIKSVIIKN